MKGGFGCCVCASGWLRPPYGEAGKSDIRSCCCHEKEKREIPPGRENSTMIARQNCPSILPFCGRPRSVNEIEIQDCRIPPLSLFLNGPPDPFSSPPPSRDLLTWAPNGREETTRGRGRTKAQKST